MRSSDWQPMETAPLNPYGQAYGPIVLIWNRADGYPWPAYYSPWHGWEERDCGPAWVVPDQEPPIAPEDAKAWMPLAAPWTDSLRDVCREACAFPFGEPPCWQVDPNAKPCGSCLHEWMEGIEGHD